MARTPVVIDVGTGYTKVGFAGNSDPLYILPSVLGPRAPPTGSTIVKKKEGVDELDFLIGDECLQNSKQYPLERFIDHGLVTNWDLMEKFYEQIYWKYLRVNPEDQNIMITEPPLNTPENREYLAEIMFETFNVPGLYIAVQALLSICSTWISKKQASYELTGTVIDSGDGITSVIPVFDGQVISSGIKNIPIAGGDFTKLILDSLREREGEVPPDEAMNIAKKIKEEYCYVCQDMVKEFGKFDKDPSKQFKSFSFTHPISKRQYTFGVGYEQFLTPEIFFNPSIYSSDFSASLPELVDATVQQSPIDTRRKLYGNIVLSGGSTMYKNMGRRIQKDLQEMVDNRLQAAERRTGKKPQEIPVNVVSHKFQNIAVWFGGGVLAQSEQFPSIVRTKAQYDEVGPSICRTSATFSSVM